MGLGGQIMTTEPDPYRAPTVDGFSVKQGSLQSVKSVELAFDVTASHLIASGRRFRAQHAGQKIWKWMRYPVALALASFAGVVSYMSIAEGLVPTPGVVTFLIILPVALAGLAMAPYCIDELLIRSRVKSSPYYGQPLSITISADGYRENSQLHEVQLQWAAFTRAVEFSDGVLLFQGKKQIHWLPTKALVAPATADVLARIVKAHVPLTEA